MMKIAAAALLLHIATSAISGLHAFVAPAALHHRARAASTAATTILNIGRESNVDLSGNAWKPDSEKMGVSVDRK